MKTRRPILRITTGALGLCAIPALAQVNDDGGLRMSFGLEQRLEYGENLALEVPDEGQSKIASTRLSFNLSSTTPYQQLALATSAAVKFVDGPTGTDTLIDEPSLKLNYARDSANALVTASALIRRKDLEFLRPVEDFRNEDGVIELPEDLDDLQGSGTRTEFDLETTLELGTTSPLGFALTAGYSGIDYQDVIGDPDLVDIRRTNIGATTILRFSSTTEGSIGLRQARFEAEDEEDTVRDTTTAEVGLDHALSARTSLSTRLGYSIVDTEEFGVTEREEGIEGSFGLDFDMPNGSVSTNLTATTNQDGTRLGIDIGRSLELPNGELSATIGLTRPETGSTEVIGDLYWLKNLPDGQITARLARSVSTTNDDTEKLTTLLNLGYTRELTAVSGLNFSVFYATVDETGDQPTLDRGSVTARYSHALTQDWSMNFGVSYEMLEEEEGRAESPTVFVSLGRNWEF